MHFHPSYNISLSLIIKQSFTVMHKDKHRTLFNLNKHILFHDTRPISYPVFTPTSSRWPLPTFNTHNIIPRLHTYQLPLAPSYISHNIIQNHIHTIPKFGFLTCLSIISAPIGQHLSNNIYFHSCSIQLFILDILYKTNHSHKILS